MKLKRLAHLILNNCEQADMNQRRGNRNLLLADLDMTAKLVQQLLTEINALEVYTERGQHPDTLSVIHAGPTNESRVVL